MAERLCWFESSPGHLVIEALTAKRSGLFRARRAELARGRKRTKKPPGAQRPGRDPLHGQTWYDRPTGGQSSPGHLVIEALTAKRSGLFRARRAELARGRKRTKKPPGAQRPGRDPLHGQTWYDRPTGGQSSPGHLVIQVLQNTQNGQAQLFSGRTPTEPIRMSPRNGYTLNYQVLAFQNSRSGLYTFTFVRQGRSGLSADTLRSFQVPNELPPP